MINPPLVSINMSVYNGSLYIEDAINSILQQTYRNFELIIVDDGSTDNTVELIRKFTDKRIVLFVNDHDYIQSLNKALMLSKGKYIARMDADDIMHIDRLAIQTAVMEENPEIDICSTWMSCFDNNGFVFNWKTKNGFINNPIHEIMESCFVLNPTSMMKNSFIKINNLKYKDYIYAEDLKFWCDAAISKAIFYVESQYLHYYRLSPGQNSCLFREKQASNSIIIRNEVSLLLNQDAIKKTNI